MLFYVCVWWCIRECAAARSCRLLVVLLLPAPLQLPVPGVLPCFSSQTFSQNHQHHHHHWQQQHEFSWYSKIWAATVLSQHTWTRRRQWRQIVACERGIRCCRQRSLGLLNNNHNNMIQAHVFGRAGRQAGTTSSSSPADRTTATTTTRVVVAAAATCLIVKRVENTWMNNINKSCSINRLPDIIFQ